MKYYLLILLITLAGCCTPCDSIKKNTEEVNCSSAPQIWWGFKGESPENNNLWKCYDWILQKR